MRLGKLEKWILIHCYLKTIEKEVLISWNKPRMFSEKIKGEKEGKYLWKSEILLNYFPNLRLSAKIAASYTREKFEATKEYRQALVTLSRTFRQLEAKSLVNIWCVVGSTGISLTHAGIEKATELLNVNI